MLCLEKWQCVHVHEFALVALQRQLGGSVIGLHEEREGTRSALLLLAEAATTFTVVASWRGSRPSVL